jgi:PucR C-terminal helix-turn-helix domain/GGDEF-like domain
MTEELGAGKARRRRASEQGATGPHITGEPFPPVGDQAQRLTEVAGDLVERTEELVAVLVEAIGREADGSEDGVSESHPLSAEVCAANVRSVLSALTDEDAFDLDLATETGIDRARIRSPLASIIDSDRIKFRRLWEVIVVEGRLTADRDRATLSSLTARLHAAEDLYINAMVAGYRSEQNRQLLGETTHRGVLIDSLLQGPLDNQWALGSVAHQLRLPVSGPFVVVAAELPAGGDVGLPGVESKLRSLDVYSAWRTLPDLQVGIVHVASSRHLQRTLALVERLATRRVPVGVSAQFDDLRDSAHALHFAKVMLRSRNEGSASIGLFDGTLLATAAVGSPELMMKSAQPVLACFEGLFDDERATLFETFRVWQDTDASARETAELLGCHPNTVRYRLQRIERCTGRLLSRPRDIAELCLAFEVQRRLM